MQRFNLRHSLLGALVALGLGGTISLASGQMAHAGDTPRSAARAAAAAARQDRHPKVDFSQGCEGCHEKKTPQVVERFRAGAHASTSVNCMLCHGDGEAEFKRQPSSEVCATCHAEYAADIEPGRGNGCFDCHNGHSLKFHQR